MDGPLSAVPCAAIIDPTRCSGNGECAGLRHDAILTCRLLRGDCYVEIVSWSGRRQAFAFSARLSDDENDNEKVMRKLSYQMRLWPVQPCRRLIV